MRRTSVGIGESVTTSEQEPADVAAQIPVPAPRNLPLSAMLTVTSSNTSYAPVDSIQKPKTPKEIADDDKQIDKG